MLYLRLYIHSIYSIKKEPSRPQDFMQILSAETIGTASCLRIFLLTALKIPPLTGYIIYKQ